MTCGWEANKYAAINRTHVPLQGSPFLGFHVKPTRVHWALGAAIHVMSTTRHKMRNHRHGRGPVPNRCLVPGSREKRRKTEKNGEKRGETGGKRGGNGEKRGKSGGGGGGGYFGQNPPTRFLTHLDPPLFIILWGAFFANQIEAKALSRVRHPSPKG